MVFIYLFVKQILSRDQGLEGAKAVQKEGMTTCKQERPYIYRQGDKVNQLKALYVG